MHTSQEQTIEINTNPLSKLTKGVAYLINRLKECPEQIVTDKTLKELVSLSILLNENKEPIAKEEYHRIEIHPEHSKRVKDSEDYQLIRSNKNAVIQMEETTGQDICMITQKEIEERIEAPCGHVFDKKGLLFFYSTVPSKYKFKCPYVGCKSDWHKMKYNPKKSK
ncbi:hypothetical protein NEPAR04_2065 [Nematocida parisii]|nr:hypothetical protein NEPAR03_0932 [Nematocida parisii]KAI5130603.1 hypothetical protein NEPAR08_2112 [Nematocida parisii]KAI5144088.1 hypothetical protein NEPAR04_2065 [Nematocida parisii]